MGRSNTLSANNNSSDQYEMELLEKIMVDNKDYETIDEYNLGTKYNQQDDLWHEEQIARNVILRKKIEEYVHSFTVHGLTRVFTGTKMESLFWLLMLLGGVLLSILVIHGLVTKYLKYGIYTEIRSQITDKNFFPSMTFCEHQLLMDSYFSYCNKPPRINHNSMKHDQHCDYKRIPSPKNITMVPNVFWSNGLFNVTKCVTWGGKKCANNKYLTTLSHFNDSCITWNYNGDLHDIYSHVELDFEFYPPPSIANVDTLIIAVPHDPEVQEIDITGKVDLEPFKNYEIKLEKTVINRLPYPYPSNCTFKKDGDIFPGKYARRSCIESNNYIEMYKQCGDTLDYIRQFIPPEIKQKYRKNNTIRDTELCIWQYGKGETKRSKSCAFPCEDLELGIASTFNERFVRNAGSNASLYRVSIQYQGVDAFKVMQEKELYSWDQLACEMGGFIGLVIGASVISLVEILAYIFLIFCRKFCY